MKAGFREHLSNWDHPANTTTDEAMDTTGLPALISSFVLGTNPKATPERNKKDKIVIQEKVLTDVL